MTSVYKVTLNQVFKENEAPGLCTSARARKLDVTLMCRRRNVIRELRDNDPGNEVDKGQEIFSGAIYEGYSKVAIRNILVLI